MRIRTIVAVMLSSASAAFAQGGRKGGPMAQRPTCLDESHVESIQILKGAAAVATYGPDAKNGIVIIYPKAGGGSVMGPCSTTPTPMDDPFNANLFAPSWVMNHQQDIGLSDEQKNFISQQITIATTRFTLNEVKLRREMEDLNNLLAATPVNESRVLDAVDRVLMLEREIKRAQVSLMVSVKNKLTEQQQAQLVKLRGDDN